MNNEIKPGILKIDSSLYKTNISPAFANRKAYVPANPGIIVSHIPGTIIQVFVSPGAVVHKGDDLVILDAMKMKNRIKCNLDGRVKSVMVSEGAKVSKGSVLLELEQQFF